MEEVEQMEGATVVEDIESVTEKCALEFKEAEAHARYRILFKQLPIGVGISTSDGTIIDANKALEAIVGYSKEELKKINVFYLYADSEQRKEVFEALKRHGSVANFSSRLKRKDGTIINTLLNMSRISIEGKNFLQITCQDITELKSMEEKVRESEEKLRNLYESIPDPLAVYVGKIGQLIEYNQAFKKAYGWTDEEMKDRIFLDFVHPDDQAMLIEEHRKEHSEKDYPLIYEIKGVNKKGDSFPMEISVGQYKRRGRVIGINVMHRDITERKKMEKELRRYSKHLEELVQERTEALRRSEEMFRGIYNSSKDAIGFASLDGILLDVNDSFPELTGYSREELLTGKKHQDMTPKKYHEYEAKIIKRILRTGKPAEYEKELVRKDGSLGPVLVTAFVVKGDDGKPIGLATIMKDITERKKAKDEIQVGNE